MSFPRYPAYKDSGVEWLGNVPARWKKVPLKAISTYNDEVLDETTAPDTEIVYVDISSVDSVNGISTKEVMPFSDAPSRARRRVRHGDVIISTVRTYLRAIARIHHPEGNLVVSTGFAIIRPRSELNADFAGYLLSASYFIEQVIARSTGVSYPAINASELVAIPVVLPPFQEQIFIAEFLDRETAKIDALIAEQQRLIELLKEKHQTIISYAVTKGLNPDVPLKPSGIEWLGDVPVHWEVRRVKSVSTFTTSGPRGWSDRIGEEGSLFVQSGDLNDALEVEFAGSKRVQVENDAESARTLLRSGDVVVCITGAKTGNVAVCAVVPEAAYINQHLCLIRLTQAILPVFLGVLLKSRLGQTYFEVSQYGLKQGLSLEDIKEAPVLLPSMAEQTAIITYLQGELSELDNLTVEAQHAIDLLQERRIALISAAVTGQIDVREPAMADAA